MDKISDLEGRYSDTTSEAMSLERGALFAVTVSDGRGKHCAHFRASKLGIFEAADLIEQCLRVGKKLLICGNDGSAADAAHF